MMPRRWRKLWQWKKGLAKSVRRAGLCLLDGMKDARELALAAGGRHEVADLVVENDDARGISLLMREIGDRCDEISREIELVDVVRAIRHRSAGVEQQGELRVGFAAIPLQIHALGAGENVPVDVPQVVAFAYRRDTRRTPG